MEEGNKEKTNKKEGLPYPTGMPPDDRAFKRYE